MTYAPSKDSDQPQASVQSDQSLCCPPEETLVAKLPTEHTAKALIRLDRCPG